MALPVPASLSPSSLANFTGCGLLFRFASVERLPEPATVAATRGTLVHAALEHLFTLDSDDRIPEVAIECLDAAVERLRPTDDWTGLALDDAAEATLRTEALQLLDNYFLLEDPRAVTPVGLEMKMEAEIDGVVVRGIIDRLDLVDGDLVVTDYKTGRAPGDAYARQRMTGVHLYALLCEQTLGRRPARVQLLHLAEPVCIVADTTEQSSVGLSRRLGAAWRAIEQACATDDFLPRPSSRCSWCAFRQWCPVFGGDPSRAAADIERTAAEDASGQGSLLSV